LTSKRALSLAFLPLDERPVNIGLPAGIAAIAGASLVLPPPELLPRLRQPGDADGLGRWLENHPAVFNRLDKLVNRGRRVQTRTVFWFFSLYMVGGMRRFRRGLLRHEKELAHLNGWLKLVTETAPKDYPLPVEILKCRRLVKGYSDTAARGNSRFERVLQSVPQLIGKPDSAGWLRRLTTAALADEDGTKLTGAQKTLETAFEAEQPRVA